LAVVSASVLVACTASEPSTADDSGTNSSTDAGANASTTDAGANAGSGDAGANMGSGDAGDQGDASGSVPAPKAAYTHKMMKATGENQFAALGYECSQCTFAQWEAIVPPAGWMKGPAQVLVASSGELRSRPSFDGVDDAVDFVPEVPGDEYELIVKNLDGKILKFGATGVIVEARVMRDTLLRFAEGKRVHELTDPAGRVFVLFAYGVDPSTLESPDFEDPDALGNFSGPDDWVYSSRVLDQELLLDTSSVATVLAFRRGAVSTWQLR